MLILFPEMRSAAKWALFTRVIDKYGQVACPDKPIKAEIKARQEPGSQAISDSLSHK